MILLLEGNIDEAMLQKLIDAYNMLDEKGGRLDIIFHSGGGEVETGYAIIDLINLNATRTTLTAFLRIGSMATNIFFETICPRKITRGTRGMFHLRSWDHTIVEGGNSRDKYEAWRAKLMKTSLKSTIIFYKSLGITEEEIEQIISGEDLFVDEKRLEKMLKITTR